MQRSSASERVNSWLRWGRFFFFGVLLGLLQLGLLLQGAKLEEWATTLWPVIAIGALLYVLMAAIEGFLAAWQTADAPSGAGSGCLVAGMGFLVLVIIAILGAILSTLPQCQPGPYGGCGHGPPAGAAAGILTILFIVEGLGSIVGGLVGGWIGGLLGERCAR